jgi:hypothetical protein
MAAHNVSAQVNPKASHGTRESGLERGGQVSNFLRDDLRSAPKALARVRGGGLHDKAVVHAAAAGA